MWMKLGIGFMALLSMQPARAATLFEGLGGVAGIERLTTDTLDRAVRDPRIAWSFDNTNMERLNRLIVVQICQLTGGPCVASARSMGAAHRHLALDERHFNALVEDLQEAMESAGTPFRTQLKLLALLAPMKKEIVAP